MKLGYYLAPYTKINSKLIQNLNIKPEPLKLPEVNIGGKLLDVSVGDFLKKFLFNTQSKNKQVELHKTKVKKATKTKINSVQKSK